MCFQHTTGDRRSVAGVAGVVGGMVLLHLNCMPMGSFFLHPHPEKNFGDYLPPAGFPELAKGPIPLGTPAFFLILDMKDA